MKNIFKTFSKVKFNSDKRSLDVILAARRAARETRVDPQGTKWGISLSESRYRTLI